MLTGLDELVGGGQGINEAAAYRLDVECGAIGCSELGLQQAGRARKNEVGRGGRDNDEVDVLGLCARSLQGGAAGLQREVARGLRLIRNVALRNAGPCTDPLIACFEPLGKLGVGDDPRWKVTSSAGYAGMDHQESSSLPLPTRAGH